MPEKLLNDYLHRVFSSPEQAPATATSRYVGLIILTLETAQPRDWQGWPLIGWLAAFFLCKDETREYLCVKPLAGTLPSRLHFFLSPDCASTFFLWREMVLNT